MTLPPTPAFIGLDWGTSSLRAHLLDADGTAIECRREGWGLKHLPAGGFSGAFREVTGAWLAQWPGLPVLASGMVGSRQGWREAAYAECPADADALATNLLRVADDGASLAIVPGVIQRGEFPNVMRGEETQIFGALVAAPRLAAASLFVLPGSHSKWVDVRQGKITRFDTFMTGELFAVLRDHSLLGRPARDARGSTADPAAAAAARSRGLACARAAGARGIADRLFTARTLHLTGELSAAATLDYLSGLLVGEEVCSGLTAIGDRSRAPLVLVGDPAICELYREAFTVFGAPDVTVLGDTAPQGLWAIACAAGMLATASPSPRRQPHV